MNRCSRHTLFLDRSLVAAASLLAVACSTPSSGPSTVVGPTPSPGPIVVSGVILETGTHAVVPAATVCYTSHCTTTGQDGSYQLNTETLQPTYAVNYWICPHASADGFEGKQLCVAVGNSTATFSAALQRQIVINAGDTVTGTVYWDDGDGMVDLDEGCLQCKAIEVRIPRDGQLQATVTNSGEAAQLSVVPATPIPVRAGTTVRLTVVSTIQQNFRLVTELSQ